MNADTLAAPHEPENITRHALHVVDNIPAMAAYWDHDEVCVFVNGAYRDWFGRTREELIGCRLRDLLGPLYALNEPHIRAAYRGEAQVFERDIPTPGGHIRSSIATYTPDIVQDRVRGIFVHVADVTPLKMLERELRAAKARAEELATHDFLTGLPNRALLTDRIAHAIAVARRKKETVAILSIDLDDFKRINDTYGHVEGDRVLIEIANRMKSAVRESDTLARLGGDEFLTLSVEITSHALIEIIAGRLMEVVRPPIQLADEVYMPAISVGIALYPDNGATPEALIANSDHALYAAKNLGKGRYVFSDRKG